MRYYTVISLLFMLIVPAHAATLDPINIEIDPVVKTKTETFPPPLIGGYIEYYVEIPLPQMTLSPIDIVNISVHFTDNKMLQIVNDPEGASFDLVLSNSDFYSYPPESGDGLWSLDFRRYDNWAYPNTKGRLWFDSAPNPRFMWSAQPTSPWDWDPLFDNVQNGACFGDFTLSLRVPYSTGFPDFDPIETTTFTDNSIKLCTRGTFHPSLRVVPEPATLLLLSLGGLILRRKK